MSFISSGYQVGNTYETPVERYSSMALKEFNKRQFFNAIENLDMKRTLAETRRWLKNIIPIIG